MTNTIADFQDVSYNLFDSLNWQSISVDPDTQTFKVGQRNPFVDPSGKQNKSKTEWLRVGIEPQTITQNTLGNDRSRAYQYSIRVDTEVYTPLTVDRSRQWQLVEFLRQYLKTLERGDTTLVGIDLETDTDDDISRVTGLFNTYGR